MNPKQIERMLLKRAREEVKRGEELILLTIAAAILAAFGIALDNIYIFLSAMLVAPFFDSIITVVVLFLEKKYQKLIIGIGTLGMMVVATFFISLTTLFFFRNNIQITSELTALPGASWEYFLVAVLMGVIGTSMWVWPRASSTSAGISTAISLVPPLAHMSRAVVLGDSSLAVYAFGVFLLNLIGIIIGSIGTFYARTYWRRMLSLLKARKRKEV